MKSEGKNKFTKSIVFNHFMENFNRFHIKLSQKRFPERLKQMIE